MTSACRPHRVPGVQGLSELKPTQGLGGSEGEPVPEPNFGLVSQCSRQEPRGRDPPHIQQGTWHLRELNIKLAVGINTSYAYCQYSTSIIERYKG